jgi:hypothetical protein
VELRLIIFSISSRRLRKKFFWEGSPLPALGRDMQAGATNVAKTADEKHVETKSSTLRKFRVLLVIILVVLTIQSWLGDTVNLFYTTGSVPPPSFTLGGFLGAMSSGGLPVIWHAFEGVALMVLAVAALALSFVFFD